MSEPATFVIEDPDGTKDSVSLPTGFTDIFAEEGEGAAEVLGDIAVVGAAQQIHAVVHHGHGETSEEIETVEKEMLELFEERFGRSFGEMTGHSH